MKYLLATACLALAACNEPPTPQEEANSERWGAFYQEQCHARPQACNGGFLEMDGMVYRIEYGDISTSTPPYSIRTMSLDNGTGMTWRFENVTGISLPDVNDPRWQQLAIRHAAQFTPEAQGLQ